MFVRDLQERFHPLLEALAGRGSLVRMPEDAAWLATFKSELLGFPNARHDDQADALSQLMFWTLRNRQFEHSTPIVGPTLFIHHDDGSTEVIGEHQWGTNDWDNNDERSSPLF